MAKQCLQDMKKQGVKPDPPIHLSFLAACSHAGLAKEGYHHFKSMEEEYGTVPTIEHFNSLVDLLGRAGKLSDAEELLQTMPNLPTLPAWVALLNASKAYGNSEVGRRCFIEVSRLDPDNASGYAIMSDIFVDKAMQST
jgi:pentatricopeptide repeat protein